MCSRPSSPASLNPHNNTAENFIHFFRPVKKLIEVQKVTQVYSVQLSGLPTPSVVPDYTAIEKYILLVYFDGVSQWPMS